MVLRSQSWPLSRPECLIQRPLPHPNFEPHDRVFHEHKPSLPSQRSPELTRVLRRWPWEICSLLRSLSCLFAILVLLVIYKDKAVPEMSMGFTFNAVVSVPITAAKSSMISAVASAMGQNKWMWFKCHKRPLYYLEVLDEASFRCEDQIEIVSNSWRPCCGAVAGNESIRPASSHISYQTHV